LTVVNCRWAPETNCFRWFSVRDFYEVVVKKKV